MTFALYKGPTKVWEETQSVDVVDGIFNVLLGKVTPLNTVPFDTAIDLGIKVGTDPEMSPRTPLAGAAYAKALPGLYTFHRTHGTNDSENVIGGANNVVDASVTGATISGGGGIYLNAQYVNQVSGDYGTIGGGLANASGKFATVGGGLSNTATNDYSTVSGGSDNVVSGNGGTVSGGVFNKVSGSYSAACGGYSNLSRGYAATSCGGLYNSAKGDYSFAAGYSAKANHAGSFVWNDRSVVGDNDSLVSTNTNQFIIRARNGVGINRAPASYGIHLKQSGSSSSYGIRTEYYSDSDYWDTYIDGANDYNFAYNGTLRGYIRDTDGVYVSSSDARLKEDVAPYGNVLDGILRLHPSTYRFKDVPAESPRSLGLIAQEVEPLFPELVSEKDGLLGLNYSGLSVIAIKAIQELNALVEAQQEQLRQQQAEIDQLSAALSSATGR